MPYKCPPGQEPVKRKYKPYNGEIIPTAIKLPDGREVAVKEITNKIKNRQHINLQTRNRSKKPTANSALNFKKYSPGERLWQSRQDLETLQDRYLINEKQAYAMKYQANLIVEHMNKLGILIVDDAAEN